MIRSSVLIAEAISLVVAVVVVEWLAVSLMRTSALVPILLYAAIRLLVGVALRFRTGPSRQ